METLLQIVHFILCFFLIGVIMIQAGKGADIGAAFGAGSSQTVFGPRGAATFLSKLTTVVAVLFLVTSISLSYLARQGGGDSSVLEKVPAAGLEVPVGSEEVGGEEPAIETTPAQPLTTPDGGK